MNESLETDEARRAIAASAAATHAGRKAAGRYLRRSLLGLGAVFAAWLLLLAAIGRWVTSGSSLRAVIIAVSVALLVGLALMPARAEPVRARLSRRARVFVIAGGAGLFGALASVAFDVPVVTAVGSLVVFAYWAVCAWWFGRAG
jgi:hypothetical protein